MGKGVFGAPNITRVMVGDIPAVRLEAGGYVAAIVLRALAAEVDPSAVPTWAGLARGVAQACLPA